LASVILREGVRRDVLGCAALMRSLNGGNRRSPRSSVRVTRITTYVNDKSVASTPQKQLIVAAKSEQIRRGNVQQRPNVQTTSEHPGWRDRNRAWPFFWPCLGF